MAKFVLKNVQAAGSASFNENGDLTQPCMVYTEIQDIALQGKVLCDIVDFIVSNGIMSDSQTPIIAAWEHIKDTLAPNWVSENYS